MVFRLEPDVKKKFIQLLAIEEDAERNDRIRNDSFCSVTTEILNGQREVTVFKKLSGQVNVATQNISVGSNAYTFLSSIHIY